MAPLRLLFASTLTLGTLFGMATVVLFTAVLASGAHPATLILVLGFTILASLFGWIVGPWITDFLQGWVYSIDKLTFEEFERRHPEVAGFVRDTCRTNGMPLPRIRIVRDDNPTAYTYGTLRGNARLVLSRGLFRFCAVDEVQAVCAHELGHVKHYDFAVMTFATTALQVLYEVYWVASRMRARKNNPGPAIALVAYVFWLVGTYLVLYLSRTREYMADAFAAKTMGDPAPLQRALVRIAYGMAEVQLTADATSQRLLHATRAMGIADPKAAPTLGNAVRTVTAGDFDAARVEPIFLFDLFNPWAAVSELASTHPLTGKRIRALNEMARSLGKDALFRFAAVDRAGKALDRARLYGKFVFEVWIHFLPWLCPIPALILAFFSPAATIGAVIVGVGIGMTLKGIYRYAVGSSFEPTTMYELMCDPYASPLRGRPVELQGEIVGKALAGSVVGEDLTMKDRSGGLVMLNFESMFGVLGNLFVGFGKARRAIGKTGTARGWFRRSVFQFVDLADLTLDDGTRFDSWTRFWGMAGGVVVIAVGFVASLIGLLA